MLSPLIRRERQQLSLNNVRQFVDKGVEFMRIRFNQQARGDFAECLRLLLGFRITPYDTHHAST
jgi:hypothetical protein